MFSSIEYDLQIKNIQPPKKDLNKFEYQAIKDLRCNTDIIIKHADKGSVIIIIEKGNCIKEGQIQLNDTDFFLQAKKQRQQFRGYPKGEPLCW